MRIITLKEDEFNNFAKKHKYESFCQTSNYANFKAQQENYDIHYLGFEDNNNLVGAAMVIYKNLFWGYKYAYAPRGFLIDYTDTYLVNAVTQALKRLLYQQKFIFFKIDPPIIVSERDFNGNYIYQSETVNDILNTLQKNDYEHLGFNLYNESILTRFNVFAKLFPNAKTMYNSFDKDIRDNISFANKRAIKVFEDTTGDIDKFYDYIKKSYGRKGKRYFLNMYNHFSKTGDIKIFYAEIDTNAYAKNTNNLYNIELEKNEGLVKIIESGDSKYDIERVINDKIESDKTLSIYKKDIITSTDMLRKYPDGILVGVSLVVTQKKGANILLNYESPEFKSFNVNEMMTFELMKYYANKNYKFINLGSVPGNFDPKSKYYNTLISKKGFNSSVIEYIGEFDLIINPMMYKVYKNKSKKKKLI